MKILVVDDNWEKANALCSSLDRANLGITAVSVNSSDEAIARIRAENYVVWILDFRLEIIDGRVQNAFDILDNIERSNDTDVIIVSDHRDWDFSEAIRRRVTFCYRYDGFEDDLPMYIKPLLERQEMKKQYLCTIKNYLGIVGDSPNFREIMKTAEKIASSTDTTILITGESGTGKELIARAIHQMSKRKEGPFVAISLVELPDTLLESEIFGHEKGAFTGAFKTRIGAIERAQRGVLFLDEIGEIDLNTQKKLLRILHDKTFVRLGGSYDIKADVQIIAATNQNLETLVKEKRFREDLYYRLNKLRIRMPPLREHNEDIPGLAQYFFSKYVRKADKSLLAISADAMEILCDYQWPGNIRQLENVIEAAVIMADDQNQSVLAVSDLLQHLNDPFHPAIESSNESNTTDTGDSFCSCANHPFKLVAESADDFLGTKYGLRDEVEQLVKKLVKVHAVGCSKTPCIFCKINRITGESGKELKDILKRSEANFDDACKAEFKNMRKELSLELERYLKNKRVGKFLAITEEEYHCFRGLNDYVWLIQYYAWVVAAIIQEKGSMNWEEAIRRITPQAHCTHLSEYVRDTRLQFKVVPDCFRTKKAIKIIDEFRRL